MQGKSLSRRLWPVLPGGEQEPFGPAALPITQRKADRVANGLAQSEIDLLWPTTWVLTKVWQALQDERAPVLFAAHNPLRHKAAIQRHAREIERLDRLLIIADGQK